jgi:hypothetical protein
MISADIGIPLIWYRYMVLSIHRLFIIAKNVLKNREEKNVMGLKRGKRCAGHLLPFILVGAVVCPFDITGAGIADGFPAPCMVLEVGLA